VGLFLVSGVFAQGNLFLQSDKEIELSKNPENALLKFSTQEPVKFIFSKSQKETHFLEVLEKFEETDRVPVLVWVESDYSAKKALKRLKDFETKYIYENSNGFAGSINLEEANKLNKDKRVLVVYDADDVSRIVGSNLSSPTRLTVVESTPDMGIDISGVISPGKIIFCLPVGGVISKFPSLSATTISCPDCATGGLA